MKLTPEQLKENYDKLIGIINKTFTGERQTGLLKLYDDLADRMALAPASSIEYFHGAYPGGYVLHILNVLKFSVKLYRLWEECGIDLSGFTKDELIFCALNHDLGKIGDLELDMYIPQDSDWHIKNKGEIYKLNPELINMRHQDRSLFLLQHYGIKISMNEQIGILIHDGMFEEGNKFYWAQFNKEKALRNNLPVILHHADYMAMRAEKFADAKQTQTKETQIKTKAKDTIQNAGKLFEDLFNK